MVKKIGAVLAALMCMMTVTAYAGPLYKTQTRQIYCFSDIARAYIDIQDQNDAPVKKPDRSSVVGYIDGTKLTTSDVSRFADTGEGVADIFLVDISGSVADAQMLKVKAAIKTWAANMKEKDRIAVMTFGDDVKTLTDFTGDKNAVNAAVDSITNNDRSTQLYGALSQSLKLATRNDKGLPKRRNIILITDGLNDYAGGISENDVYAQLKAALIPVYSMQMPGSDNERGRATLNSVTEYSGGTIYDMSNKNIDTVYGWIKDSIQNTYTVDFPLGSIAADNAEHTFKVRVAEGDKVAEDSVKFVMSKTDEESGSSTLSQKVNEEENDANDAAKKKRLIILLSALGAALIAAAIIIPIALSKKKDNYIQPETYNNFTADTSTYDNSYNTVGQEYAPTVSGVGVTLRSASGQNYTATITDSIIIGRNSGRCAIALGAQTISGTHASLSLRNGKLYLEDLNSVNGTLVNGRLINSPTEVSNGDSIMFGSEEFKLIF